MNTTATASMPSAFARVSSRAHGVEIERALHRAVGAHALVDLDHALVQHVGLDDVAGENFRPRLVADAQGVAKTLGDQQQRALALALEQRIGGDRGAHLHGADAPAGIGSPALSPSRSRMPCTAASR